jgi:hypothetical protein
MKWSVPNGDKDVRVVRLRRVSQVDARVEDGDADDKSAAALTCCLPDVTPDQFGIVVCAEDRFAVPHQAL